MSSPQPMQVRRRAGAKRGEHPSYVAPSPIETPSNPSGSIGTDTTRSTSGRRRATNPVTGAQAAARAAYDAKPKVIFRGVDDQTYRKLRAIYKHQLHQPGGIEGWSEWGRSVLAGIVDQYEQTYGEVDTDEEVHLPSGRRAK